MIKSPAQAIVESKQNIAFDASVIVVNCLTATAPVYKRIHYCGKHIVDGSG